MCNICNTGCNGYGATGTCCGSWNSGQRVCRDACGNLRVYTCGGCNYWNDNQNCSQLNSGTSTNSGNGYTCIMTCGNAFATDNTTGETATGNTCFRNCGQARCGGWFGY